MSTLYLSPVSVPSGTEFPGSVQALLTLLAQYLSVNGNEGVIGINYGSTTPSADDRDKPWMKITPSGSPIGLFSWNGTEWKQTPLTSLSGDTASRPASPSPYTQYFDTDINCMLVFERGKWRTLTGNPGDVKFVTKATLAEAITHNPGWVEYKDAQGRVIGGAGAGSGMTERDYGEKVGAETHTLTTDEIPSHDHQSVVTARRFRASIHDIETVALGGGEGNATNSDSFKTGQAGGGEPHDNMQPTIFLWGLVKE